MRHLQRNVTYYPQVWQVGNSRHFRVSFKTILIIATTWVTIAISYWQRSPFGLWMVLYAWTARGHIIMLACCTSWIHSKTLSSASSKFDALESITSVADMRVMVWTSIRDQGSLKSSNPVPGGSIHLCRYTEEFKRENGTIQITSDSRIRGELFHVGISSIIRFPPDASAMLQYGNEAGNGT